MNEDKMNIIRGCVVCSYLEGDSKTEILDALNIIETAEKVKDERKTIYIEAYKKFGKEIQHVIAIEEMAELQKEISKALRGRSNRENIKNEIADVTIMLEQIALMNDIESEEIEKEIEKKIERLRERLNHE